MLQTVRHARLIWLCHQNDSELRLHVAAQVSGMTCSSCSSAVESALDAVPGVGNAVVSLIQQQARVEYDTTAVTPVRPSLNPSSFTIGAATVFSCF